MCTSIIEIARADGMAKGGKEWFPLSRAVVAYDHARHAQLGDVVVLDFINTHLDANARAGIELSLETAKELHAALDRVITAAEFEETEVRGKGAGIASGEIAAVDDAWVKCSSPAIIESSRPCATGERSKSVLCARRTALASGPPSGA
jgi:hypothetical protein